MSVQYLLNLMKKRRQILLAILLPVVMTVTAGAQGKRKTDKVPTLTSCELVRDPATYNQKTIRVRATYNVSFQGTVMSDPACSKRPVWVEFDPGFKTSTDSRVLKRFNRLIYTGLELPQSGGNLQYPSRRVRVTWVGQFQEGQGSFGLGSRFDYQFTVRRIEQVRAIDRAKPRK